MSAFSDLSPGATVTLGVIVGLLSTCIQSLGLTLQRKSHMLEDEKAEYEQRRPAYKRRRWQVGMFLFLIANIVGSTIQITTLPLPLLSTLQASGLVFNSILASLLLKEAWTWRTGYGTVLVAGGAIIISLFSALPEPSHTLPQLIRLLGYPSFLIWFCLSLVFVVTMLVMDFSMRKLVSQQRRDSPRLLLVRGMSYGAVSGILSAHALLLAKSAVELIVRSIADKRNEFSNYRSWLLVLAFLVLALSQLYYLHLGLRLISTSVLYPFVFCIYNIVAILDGLIYFRQTDRLPPLHAGLIALGTIILLAGVLALSWQLEDGNHDAQHQQMVQNEIPQTVLTPGLGFVGDPDTDESESAVAEDEVLENGERESLLDKGLKRTNTACSSRIRGAPASKRRKRASTLKEVMDIWDELGDTEEAYGTFDTGPDPDMDRRPLSAGQADRASRRRDIAGQNVVDGGAEPSDGEPSSSVQRSKTMPAPRLAQRRRRRSTHGGGSALFKDMLSIDWWRTRRKPDEHQEEDEDATAGSDERA